jgi:type 1 fimbriae regulatory protein FimB/type 1 fimbriae regulatory protein FimE
VLLTLLSAGQRAIVLQLSGHDTRRIQDWLGHRSIQHTTRYTQLSAAPFKDFWRR